MNATIKTRKDLQRLALSTGASIRAKNGSTFNSAKIKRQAPRPVHVPSPPPQKPITQPPPPQLVVNPELMKRMAAVASGVQSNNSVVRDLVQQIAGMHRPVTEWVFEVERDGRGFISRIRAKPQTKQVL